jgi:hypothetical protein
MHNTIFGENNQVQHIVFPDDYPDESLHNQPKGIKQVLIE